MADCIELRDVEIKRAGKVILARADMRLGGNDRMAIIGPNGAGKTTLLRSMVGLQAVSQGDVILFGKSCSTEAQFSQQRPRIGFLFQDSDDQLFCPSVIEDVAFGPCNLGVPKRQAHEQALQTLTELGISHLAERFSHKLSGGERRLVCLAGLLAMQPDVLLLDEPTNGVDRVNGELLRNSLQNFKGAILLVSHDQQFVLDIASRAMLLTQGTLMPANIHTHQHTHTHAHVHPST